jgi:O-antigen ligase
MPITALLGYRLKKNTLLLVLLATAVALAIFWMSPLRAAVTNIMTLQTSDAATMSAYGRILIWERVYEHALYGPWIQKVFGIGIGTFNTLQFDHFLEVGTFTTGAHNNFMHAFVETGIVGMIIYTAIYVHIVDKLAVRRRKGDNAAKCFLVATLALLLSCLTQETFWPNTSFGRFGLMHMFSYVVLFNSCHSTKNLILTEKPQNV